MNLKWLIYCRVSSTRQMTDWNWLSSQEQRCRIYAESTLGIGIEKVFYEEWISWWIFERKSIQELFKYIDEHSDENYVVIFEDLNRLSRDIQVHWLLRSEFKKRWVELACPNFKFEETPEGSFKENISVVVSEYEREKNKQRVIDRQKSRLEQWFWCFPLPIWYKYIKAEQGWKIVVRDDNYKIVRRWFKSYADKKIKTINELVLFFNEHWVKVWKIVEWKVYNASVVRTMLSNVLYTGHLQHSKRKIPLIKAKHESIISMDLYDKIQKRLSETPQYITSRINENLNRKDLTNDFPLRWFLYCEESKYMLSWAWSKWKNKKYPYYCFSKHSPNRGKSINRDKLHASFSEFMADVELNPNFVEAFKEVYLKVLEDRNKNQKKDNEVCKKEIKLLENKIEKYIDSIWDSDSVFLNKGYEKKILQLEKQIEEIKEKASLSKTLTKKVRTPLETRLDLYRKSAYIWNKGDLSIKKKLLQEIFPHWVPINKKKQVWTPTFSLVYQIIESSQWDENIMVHSAGLEPTTNPGPRPGALPTELRVQWYEFV